MQIITRLDAGLAAPRKLIPSAPRQRSRLFLHHSVTATSADPLPDWRGVQKAGFDRGFADISYTWGVHATGVALEGRNASVEGAHTEGFNKTAHAIVLVGNYHITKPPDLMVATVREFRALLVAQGFLTANHVFSMHRDVKATACPGRYVAADWPAYQKPWLAPTPGRSPVAVHQYLASLVAPNGGTWHLQDDGGIITDTDGLDAPEAPFYGSAAGGLGDARVKGILPHGAGYKIVVQHPDEKVSYFHFPAG